jgi:hypothetical protein
MYIVGVVFSAPAVFGTATAKTLTVINRIITIAPKDALFRRISILFIAKILDIFSFLLKFYTYFQYAFPYLSRCGLKTLCLSLKQQL